MIISIYFTNHKTPINGEWNYPSVCGTCPLMTDTGVTKLSGKLFGGRDCPGSEQV